MRMPINPICACGSGGNFKASSSERRSGGSESELKCTYKFIYGILLLNAHSLPSFPECGIGLGPESRGRVKEEKFSVGRSL